MSKFVIALNEDVEMLDGEQYDTLEQAKSVATNILKQLHGNSPSSLDDFEDEVCGYLDDEEYPIDDLTILEVNPAVFPDFGYMIFDGLENYSIEDGNPDDEWPEATNKEQTELNELVAKWLTDKGYTPNWYNEVNSYQVEAQHDTRTD
ncbi:MAG: hypothetical protein L0K88_05125 [Lactiplantibacillus plantarum]|nr:hypothetical protein [Lactococcus sp.]MDN6576490.1 hypothetical protein [Lactiplantibacillus plantarum]MDN6765721.1 hypothetical protein [Lactiplantibacillus plantarum]MDN6789656.1 hypothetical protein [Lactiplantibacillus plantarum]